MKTLAAVLVVLLGLLGAVVLVGLHTHQEPPVDPAWAVPGSDAIPSGAVTVRFSGTTTLVFSDGETTIVLDGWFSRPGLLDILRGRVAPDVDAIAQGLADNALRRADVVFPVHSHYDHAMDAPEVARRTGAVLMGSPSTAMIGRGWGLPEAQIRVVEDRVPIPVGRFTLVPIESRHFQFPDPAIRERALGDPEIRAPLVPPVALFDYKLGKAYALYLVHPRGRILIQGSAGFLEGALEGFAADVVFLGTGGLGSQTEAYRAAYWRETVERTGPARVVPVHWDDLTGPPRGPFRGSPRLLAFLSGGEAETLRFLKAKEAAGARFLTLPRHAPVVLFE